MKAEGRRSSQIIERMLAKIPTEIPWRLLAARALNAPTLNRNWYLLCCEIMAGRHAIVLAGRLVVRNGGKI